MVREEEKDVSWSEEVRKAGEQMAEKGEEVRGGDGVQMLGVERDVMDNGESKIDVGRVRPVMRVAGRFGTPNHCSMYFRRVGWEAHGHLIHCLSMLIYQWSFSEVDLFL